MIKLPNKGKCKLKQFNRSLILGNFVYMEFMSYKTPYTNWWSQGEHITRNMTPRKKIFKVVDKHKLELVYFTLEKDGDFKWVRPIEQYDYDANKENEWSQYMPPKGKITFNSHNIWAWFQKDEIRNIRSMTKDELAEEFLMELL